MKVFISWSGERSHEVAKLLDWWIQCTLQAVDPWLSSQDIDGGSVWVNQINNQLATTTIGLVCMTAENKENPWILFESGALAKGLESSRVCTILIDLLPSDIRPPLSQFNHTIPDQAGLYRLLRTINSALGEKALKDEVLKRVFETYWPQFGESFAKIISSTKSVTPKKKRDENDLMVEILNTVRALDKRLSGVESKQMYSNIHGLHTPHIKFYGGGEPTSLDDINWPADNYININTIFKQKPKGRGESGRSKDDDDDTAAPLVPA